ncbi:hypothetical protein JCM10449v2_000436 [Rhodotorula kratochvilovae]
MPLPYHRQQGSLSSRRSGNHSTHTSNSSLALSPVSLFNYSETDPFLSPTAARSSPPSPRFLHPSSPVSPYTPRHSHDSYESSFPSPTFRRSGPHPGPGLLSQLAVPPSAKRARSRTWILLAAAAIVALVGLVSLSGSEPVESRLVEYGTRVNGGLAKLKQWSGAKTEVDAVAADEEELDEQPIPDDGSDIPITPLPRPRLPDLDDPDAKYIGFLPHSGYHNQRIALQNALMLGKLLNRTVLIPPVWIGWPISTQYYQDLRQSWLEIMLTNPASFNLSTLTPDSPLNLPAPFPSTADEYPCPSCTADNATRIAEIAAVTEAKMSKWREAGYEVRPDGYPIIPGLKAEDCKSYSPECRFTYRDTFLAWDFLVDLDKARDLGVEIVDRWDLRERALLDQLGVTADDVYVVEDREIYDFQYSDRSTSRTELIIDNLTASHWKRTVSLATLRTMQHRVVLLGSLFGSGRVRVRREPRAPAWSEAFGQAMAFRNPWLLRPADAIVARLGGPSNYVGVHARVGDGEFARRARQNMERAWRDLVLGEMGVGEEVAEEMWERVRPNVVVGRRKEKVKRGAAPTEEAPSDWAALDGEEDDGDTEGEERASRHREKRGLLDEVKAWLPSLTGEEPSARLRNLTCRAPLHANPRFKAFNVPLYLATDSRTPEEDLNLRPFFEAFPCTFVLSDFDRPDATRNDGVVVPTVKQMGRLVNSLDGVPLGRLFLPFLEAIIAAKGRLIVGTEHSTFSSFASSSLHDAYWSE